MYQFLHLQKNNPDIFIEADKLKHYEQKSASAGVDFEAMEDLLIWSKPQMQHSNSTPEKALVAQTVQNTNELLQTQLQKTNIILATVISQSVN